MEAEGHSSGEIMRALGFALLAHLCFVIGLLLVEPPSQRRSPPASGASAPPIRVRLQSASRKSEPSVQPVVEPLTALSGGASPSAPRIPVVRRLPRPAPVQVQPDLSTEETARNPVLDESKADEQQPSPSLPSDGFPQNRRLAKLFPSASQDYLRQQRDVGYDRGRDQADSEDFLPLPDAPEKLRGRERPAVVATEFSTLAYRIELERRFSEAWGGVRYLPRGASFVGNAGELILYNVIINRDGTLRRIVNVSALEQGNRDYSAVDRLVQEFADSVFPLNPIPDRIRTEPFIVRWPIRYGGFHYSFF
jgi:hypothetical protein